MYTHIYIENICLSFWIAWMAKLPRGWQPATATHAAAVAAFSICKSTISSGDWTKGSTWFCALGTKCLDRKTWADQMSRPLCPPLRLWQLRWPPSSLKNRSQLSTYADKLTSNMLGYGVIWHLIVCYAIWFNQQLTVKARAHIDVKVVVLRNFT